MSTEELIAALEKAEGPNRELDREIIDLVHGGYPVGITRWSFVPAPTSSLDTIVDLIEWALPGCDWLINSRGRYACIWQSKESGGNLSWEARGASSLPIALCIAFLRGKASTK